MVAFSPPRIPRTHQREAMEKAQGLPGFAYHMEMGSGKSLVFWYEVLREFVNDRADGALITAASGSYFDWLKKHIPENHDKSVPIEIYLWDGSGTMHAKRMQKQIIMKPIGRRILRVLIMNIESLGASARAQSLAKDFVNSGRMIAGIDESTTIKNHESSRWKFLDTLRPKFVMRRNLTGTPVTKNPLDIWGQYEFVAKGHLRQRSFTGFKARYALLKDVFIAGGRSVKVPYAYQNLDELSDLISDISYRKTKAECLDLPPKLYNMVDVEFTDQQKSLYDNLKKNWMAELSDESYMTTKSPAQRMIRLHQIACGHFVDDDGFIHDIPNNRIDRLMAKIEETSGQVVIWCGYKRSVQLVLKALREAYGENCAAQFDGSVGRDARERDLSAFQAGDKRFIAATVHTLARGRDLTCSTDVFYFSNSHDLELRQQSEDRNHRMETTSPVNYNDLRVRGTIDDQIIFCLRNKIDIAAVLNRDPMPKWLIQSNSTEELVKSLTPAEQMTLGGEGQILTPMLADVLEYA